LKRCEFRAYEEKTMTISCRLATSTSKDKNRVIMHRARHRWEQGS